MHHHLTDSADSLRRSNASSTTGPAIDVTVKWYDGKKGYGFVETPDESDAFVHGSRFRDADINEALIGPGAVLSAIVGEGKKGPGSREVTKVLDVVKPADSRAASRARALNGVTCEYKGHIKWFDPAKFGFAEVVGLDDIHIPGPVGVAAGLTREHADAAVVILAVADARGLKAVSVELLD